MKKKKISTLLATMAVLGSTAVPAGAVVYAEGASTYASQEVEKNNNSDLKKNAEHELNPATINPTAISNTIDGNNLIQNSGFNRAFGQSIESWSLFTGPYVLGLFSDAGGLSDNLSEVNQNWVYSTNATNLLIAAPDNLDFGFITSGIADVGTSTAIAQTIETIPGRTYTASLYVKTVESGTLSVEAPSNNLLVYNGQKISGAGEELGNSGYSVSTPISTKVETEFNAVSTESTVSLRSRYLDYSDGNYSGVSISTPEIYEHGNDITVNHVDLEGNELADSEALEGFIGGSFEATAKVITGYTLTNTPINATGIFTRENQTVTFIYERSQGAPVTVNYIDTEGTPVASSVELTGLWGNPFETEAKIISGYELIETPVNATGTFTETPQIVNYVYSRIVTSAPTIDPYYKGDAYVTGTIGGEIVKVSLFDQYGNIIRETTDVDAANETYKIYAGNSPALQEVGAVFFVSGTNAAGIESERTKSVVQELSLEAPTLDPFHKGDMMLNGQVTGENVTHVRLYNPLTDDSYIIAVENDSFSMYVANREFMQEVGNEFEVRAVQRVLNGDGSIAFERLSDPVSGIVLDSSEGEDVPMPVVNGYHAGQEFVMGTVEAGVTRIALYDAEGVFLRFGQVNPDGSYIIYALDRRMMNVVGNDFSVVAVNANGAESEPVVGQVQASESSAPIIDAYTVGDVFVTGTLSTSSTASNVLLFDANHNLLRYGQVNADGTFKVYASDLAALQAVGATFYVRELDKAGNLSSLEVSSVVISAQ